MTNLADRFGAWTGELPPIECNDAVRGCFPAGPALPGDFGDGRDSRVSYPEEATPIAPLQRSPTRAEKSAERRLCRNISSMALDLAPFVGMLKSAAEVITGRDPVTGQTVSHTAAAIGFVASFVPSGRSILEYGSKKFRHYTSRSGSDGILRTGVIKANRGKIYAEGGNRKVLAPRDAEQRYNIRTGRGRDYVEFQVPKGARWREQIGLGGAREIVIEGDVPLGPGARVIQRR